MDVKKLLGVRAGWLGTESRCGLDLQCLGPMSRFNVPATTHTFLPNSSFSSSPNDHHVVLGTQAVHSWVMPNAECEQKPEGCWSTSCRPWVMPNTEYEQKPGGWWSIVLQESKKWLIVCPKLKRMSKQVWMEPPYSKYTSQALLFQLGVILLAVVNVWEAHPIGCSFYTSGIWCASMAPTPYAEASHARTSFSCGSKWTRRGMMSKSPLMVGMPYSLYKGVWKKLAVIWK